MTHKIFDWLDIAGDFSETLLVGNGASVAVHGEFGYRGLYEAAQVHRFIDAAVQDVFTKFETNDFELVLRRLWQTKQVNTALGIAVKEVDDAYSAVRGALIKTVQRVHVSYEDAKASLSPIYKFMRQFRTVISLNYDLIVYWAAQFGNDDLGSRYHFKDGFNRSVFADNWAMYRESYGGIENPTIFCYPHGNIALGMTMSLDEQKILAVSQDLLNSIIDAWNTGTCAPIFVCDGTSKQKIEAISKSNYLRSVYDGPLSEVGESLVIYGWGIAKQEEHILKRIGEAAPKRIAVSVYDGMQTYCDHAHRVLSDIGVRDIRFFHSNSDGAWNNPVPLTP
ncbi:hypothetical protein CH72_4825 [Burkholderia ambifaria AMMD]|uniref:Uncharacterized protein n=1 Tax=Burkholderia ambifaria (strain ATCC BAA-244 / DSM 16087 / CCUG 44356 / LMG 19182 / AMMD) TaxID=339670 RepID=Q0B688_BURCM|nr:DUF4917 family protein [Burkholderia ambifaria]ABI90335.1 conserved hypothetical protein [Burkholderia ambifaria AMMD]AJY25819.1 hypothetical protein CH72_4825 [Burkholderia ambifaria AMMD]MBR7931891.1 DUF4917 family protein [Burkholderia ambifaria]PEH68386.1 DUF4917 domain-containing protein [Burkholderia ambifaria]QQC07044.1 DUF4917 family protein [Burkholderia ambifaria]